MCYLNFNSIIQQPNSSSNSKADTTEIILVIIFTALQIFWIGLLMLVRSCSSNGVNAKDSTQVLIRTKKYT